ncbi:MAG: hypothetical protein IKR19_07835 [Acholeplasmatales bacterium]|nr:hypothetical protein [Acholeplasmatales bacterium]
MAVAENKCKGCTKRYLGCHDKCESYQEYKRKREEFNAARQKAIHNNAHFKEKRQKALKRLRQQGRL